MTLLFLVLLRRPPAGPSVVSRRIGFSDHHDRRFYLCRLIYNTFFALFAFLCRGRKSAPCIISIGVLRLILLFLLGRGASTKVSKVKAIWTRILLGIFLLVAERPRIVVGQFGLLFWRWRWRRIRGGVVFSKAPRAATSIPTPAGRAEAKSTSPCILGIICWAIEA